MLTIENYREFKRNEKAQAIRWAKKNFKAQLRDRTMAVIFVDGRVLVVSMDEAYRIESAGHHFAFLHFLNTANGQIVTTIPVN